ncbi:MAG: hypothetical protein EA427_16010 [Spirochaetaceae bacterium]|nr:MAG: hypothetical protein EA427_16010 [Spirochaetaceae bacterium]
MSNPDPASIATLRAHITKHLDLLDQSQQEIVDAISEDIPILGKTPRAAVLVAGLLENYYTCAETIFVRISQFFENNLDTGRWHKDLLERMTLKIEPVRPQVISQPVKEDLVELMRFRHFRRYYFGAAYDWERLDALVTRCNRVHPTLLADVRGFLGFLNTLLEE